MKIKPNVNQSKEKKKTGMPFSFKSISVLSKVKHCQIVTSGMVLMYYSISYSRAKTHQKHSLQDFFKQISTDLHNLGCFQRLHTHQTSFKDTPV
jgi:hypothetical protein